MEIDYIVRDGFSGVFRRRQESNQESRINVNVTATDTTNLAPRSLLAGVTLGACIICGWLVCQGKNHRQEHTPGYVCGYQDLL